MPHKQRFLKTLVALILIVCTIMFTNCNSCNKSVKIETLTIGIQNSPSNSLVIIASEKKFFDSTKVRIDVKEFTAGKLAMQAMLGQANDLDIAVSAETPVVLSSFGGNKIKVIAEVVNAKNECRVVVRKDGNLNKPETYFSKPRKLATSQGGSPEWLTYNFIKKYNLDKSKIEILAMLPENMPTAISTKAVDAISIFDPFARIGETQLGNNGLTFLNTDISSYYVLSVKETTFNAKEESLKELLKGLIKAEDFIKNNPGEAKKIISEKTKLDINIINSTWGNYSFNLQLHKAFLDLCKSESSWIIESGKYPKGTAIPDYSKIMDAKLLKDVASEKVRL